MSEVQGNTIEIDFVVFFLKQVKMKLGEKQLKTSNLLHKY
jgi:hypothetical protein